MPASDHPPDQPPGSPPPGSGLPVRTPDLVEQEYGDELDDIVPTQGYKKTPVVGLGGSAGGLAALRAFFEAMPPDSGMAFVVIMHLAPQHESFLAELFQRTTTMPVRQVQGRLHIEPNHVYVIPPGGNLSTTDGSLVLTAAERESGKHVAVDLFFRALADTHGPHGVAVVLSGADGDGAIGLKRVKERGGLTVVQEPTEAEHAGMPLSAIATGLVDWVLPVAEMPARLLAYWQTERRLYVPPEAGLPSANEADSRANEEARAQVETALHDTLGALRVRTGHDFTYYKRATVLRRISRRMQVNGLDDPRVYLEFIRANPDEPEALLRDLLISVTNFFRDREAFTAFEMQIPALFRDKGPADEVRVWVAACATGEEAYSVAMLLHEYAADMPNPPRLQVFATDLDEHAIALARDGVYPETISADVSEGRRRRFFIKEFGGYRVRRELRETVLFALHDLLKDSPFSRLDAVTCRNLLIYLNADAQKHALDIFHFALHPNGTLFLGSSESVDDDAALFTTVDKKRRIFARNAGPRVTPPLNTNSSTLVQAMMRPPQQLVASRAVAIHRSAFRLTGAPTLSTLEKAVGPTPASWSDLHYEYLEQVMPPSVLVNAEYQIVHVSERAGRFLTIGGGDASMNLLQLVQPGLRIELRTALYQAAQSREIAEARSLPLETDDGPKSVNLRVVPSRAAASTFLLVIFEEQNSLAAAPPPPARQGTAAEPVIWRLEQELAHAQRQLRNTIEQSDASTEELKATNEEFQAMNEELRSTSEELETGREELQSVNEELSTVNQELKSKVEDLGRSNSDLQNLMASTRIATMFLDRELRITRYTPSTVSIFKLIPSDVGRPLGDVKHRLDYPELEEDARQVLTQLTSIEHEVGQTGGNWFLARLQPYRSLQEHIGGVVLTFVDITARKKAEDTLAERERQFRSFVHASTNSEYKMSADWREMRFLEGKHFLADTPDPSRTWLEMYIPPEDHPTVLAAIREAIDQKRPFELEHRIFQPDGVVGWTFSRAVPLLDARNEIIEWYGAASDITARKEAEAATRQALQDAERARGEAEAATRAKDQFLAVLSHELRTPLMPVTLVASILQRRTDLPETVREAVRMIQRNVETETRLIDDLLDVTRISHGKLEIVSEATDLHEALSRAVEVTAPDVVAKDQHLETALDAPAHRLHGDSARLQQVFWNLLKNASKFTPEGGHIQLRTRAGEPGRIVVEVTDDGIGIDPQALPHIFDAFTQAGAHITRKYGGLGLGLAIARATVEAHGGTLTAHSAGIRQGSTFTADLPLTGAG